LKCSSACTDGLGAPRRRSAAMQQQPRHGEPQRVTEADVKREQRLRTQSGSGGAGTGVPTTVLSLWQPLASFLAHGLQRVEGRGWSTEFRGPLWIHAGSKQVAPEDIAKWEGLYRAVFAADGTNIQLPESYPTSALVGLVEIVDVVTAEEFGTWRSLPRGVRQEGRSHGSGSLFLVQNHKKLVVPLKMSGQHKLWRLETKIAQQVFSSLLSSSQGQAIDFAHHRELAKSGSGQAEALTPEGLSAGEDEDEDEGELDDFLMELALQRSLQDNPAGPEPFEGENGQSSVDDRLLQQALQASMQELSAAQVSSEPSAAIAAQQKERNTTLEESADALGPVAVERRRGPWGRGAKEQNDGG